MAIEVPQNEEISGRVKNGGEGVGSAVCRRRANRGIINVKEGEGGRLFSEMLTFT